MGWYNLGSWTPPFRASVILSGAKDLPTPVWSTKALEKTLGSTISLGRFFFLPRKDQNDK